MNFSIVASVVIGGSLPTAIDLNLNGQGGNDPIQAFTCVNQTSLTISVFIGQTSPSGTPSFQILPYQAITTPIANFSDVTVSFSGNITANGTAYFHIQDTPLSSNTTPITFQNTLVPVPFTAAIAQVPLSGITTVANLGTIQPGQSCIITDLWIDGLAKQNVLYQVAFNAQHMLKTINARGDFKMTGMKFTCPGPQTVSESVGLTIDALETIIGTPLLNGYVAGYFQ